MKKMLLAAAVVAFAGPAVADQASNISMIAMIRSADKNHGGVFSYRDDLFANFHGKAIIVVRHSASLFTVYVDSNADGIADYVEVDKGFQLITERHLLHTDGGEAQQAYSKLLRELADHGQPQKLILKP